MIDQNKFEFENLINLFKQTQGYLQSHIAKTTDIALVVRNWLFGWYIIEFEQSGSSCRADLYGKKLMSELSKKLTESMGRGFSKRSVEQIRLFYKQFQNIAQVMPAQSSTTELKGTS